MPRKETYSGPISAQAQQDLVSEGIENFELPKSVVMKIAKSSIPENVKLQKETVLSLVKGSTVFINYLAATAHDVAQSKQHKSISASDVLKALETIEFSDMANKLQGELLIFRELSKNDKGKKSTTTTTNGGGASSSASAKKGASVAGASTSASAPPTTATTKGKGKEKVIHAPTIGGSPLNGGFFSGVPVPAFPHLPPHPHPHSPPSLVGGPFTSAPLDLPTAHSPIAHSPMDVDYDAEGSVSAPPPIPMTMGMGMGRPFQIGREDRERELDGDDEERRLAEQEQEEEVEEVVSEEEEAGEEEEEEDKELVEEQELRKDALGVEERSMVEDD